MTDTDQIYFKLFAGRNLFLTEGICISELVSFRQVWGWDVQFTGEEILEDEMNNVNEDMSEDELNNFYKINNDPIINDAILMMTWIAMYWQTAK